MPQYPSIPGMAKPSPNHAGDPVLVAVGRAIRAVRLLKEISQEQLANETGIDRSYMGGVERGEHNLTIMTLGKIARGLRMTCAELLSEAGI